MSDWRASIRAEWKDRVKQRSNSSSPEFPLIGRTFDDEEVLAVVDVVLSGQLTMSSNTKQLESQFAEYLGVKYAVMVNSGSSANLLAVAVATNPARKKAIPRGSEVLVPAVCWSTSVWPLIQCGLKPVLVDVDPSTLNMDLVDAKKKITSDTSAVMMVHVLGNSCDMQELLKICDEHKLELLEDTCESLGSKAHGRYLGSFGSFGMFSFYFSHHMTTGEGGMVVTNSLEDYDLLKCLRAHGWTRELSNRAQVESMHSRIDPRFLFVNVGYNLRPLEVSAAMGILQLQKLPYMNATRNLNRDRLVKAIESHPGYAGQLLMVAPGPEVQPAWFGFCALLHPKFEFLLPDYFKHLTGKGVENRPIVSGNFARQPAFALHGFDILPTSFPNAEVVGNCGFFIGLHVEPLSQEQINHLADALVAFDWRQREVVLVTGSGGLVGSALAKSVAESKEQNQNRKWIFCTRKDADLRSLEETRRLFSIHRPTHVIHLAVDLRAGYQMKAASLDMWSNNNAMNENVLRCAHEFDVKKLISCLSAFAYPENPPQGYPMTEDVIHVGLPHGDCETYGTTKRVLDVLTRSYRAQHKSKFVTVCPTNIFGPGQLRADGPVVEGIISRVLEAKRNNKELLVHGSGKPLRQLLFSMDFARALLWALDQFDDNLPINIVGEEVSIAQLVDEVCRALNFQGKVVWDTSKTDGPARRTLSDERFRALNPQFARTPLSVAIQETVGRRDQ